MPRNVWVRSRQRRHPTSAIGGVLAGDRPPAQRRERQPVRAAGAQRRAGHHQVGVTVTGGGDGVKWQRVHAAVSFEVGRVMCNANASHGEYAARRSPRVQLILVQHLRLYRHRVLAKHRVRGAGWVSIRVPNPRRRSPARICSRCAWALHVERGEHFGHHRVGSHQLVDKFRTGRTARRRRRRAGSVVHPRSRPRSTRSRDPQSARVAIRHPKKVLRRRVL